MKTRVANVARREGGLYKPPVMQQNHFFYYQLISTGKGLHAAGSRLAVRGPLCVVPEFGVEWCVLCMLGFGVGGVAALSQT